jgi:hypothetical protein
MDVNLLNGGEVIGLGEGETTRTGDEMDGWTRVGGDDDVSSPARESLRPSGL